MSEASDQAPDPSSLSQQQDVAVSSIAAESVVPSLMQVYNTMVQSKTPEGGARAVATPSTTFSTSGGGDGDGTMTTAEEWNAYTAATAATGNTSLPSIPPPPDTNNAMMMMYSGNERGDEKVDPSATAVETASNRRGGLRRKRASQTSLKEPDDDSPCASVTSSGRGGGSSKSRRKAKETDNRWSKRFSWPEDLHRDFVAAIFDVGLKHSSPSTILEHMPKHEQITSERVKSHLQKYRLHRVKSKKEFMSSYDAGLKKLSKGTLHGSISGGEVASLLSQRDMHEPPPPAAPAQQQGAVGGGGASRPATVETDEGPSLTKEAKGSSSNKNNTAATSNPNNILTLPRLTEAEKQSPIGASMGYLMGLFFSLKQQLMAQRAAAKAAEGANNNKDLGVVPPVTAVYDAFVGTGAGSLTAANATATTASTLPTGPASHVISGNLPISSTNNPVPSATVVSNPSTRSNLEENNMMKREMQSQMAFQNKMRGLKEQELNKFRNNAASEDTLSSGQQHVVASSASGTHHTTTTAAPLSPSLYATAAAQQQGAGEVAVADGRQNRSLSIGNADEFWNTDVMDEQLFEFLMSE